MSAQLEKGKKGLEQLKLKLNKYKLKTKEEIDAKIGKILKGCQSLYTIELIENQRKIKQQVGRGRPKQNTKYEKRVVRTYELNWTLNQKAIEAKHKTNGSFSLITNTDLAAADVLKTYKNQLHLEKRFYTFKSVLEVDPIFLHNPKRVEAILFLYFIALVERNIKQNMKNKAVKSISILPSGKKTKNI